MSCKQYKIEFLGPDNAFKQNALIESFKLTAATEKHQYKHNVQIRMSRVRVFACDGDKKTKRTSIGFDYALYAAKDALHPRVIESKMLSGML